MPIGSPGASTTRLTPSCGKSVSPSNDRRAPTPSQIRQRPSRAFRTNHPSSPTGTRPCLGGLDAGFRRHLRGAAWPVAGVEARRAPRAPVSRARWTPWPRPPRRARRATTPNTARPATAASGTATSRVEARRHERASQHDGAGDEQHHAEDDQRDVGAAAQHLVPDEANRVVRHGAAHPRLMRPAERSDDRDAHPDHLQGQAPGDPAPAGTHR